MAFYILPSAFPATGMVGQRLLWGEIGFIPTWVSCRGGIQRDGFHTLAPYGCRSDVAQVLNDGGTTINLKTARGINCKERKERIERNW